MTTKRPSLKERVFEKLQGSRSRSNSDAGSDSEAGGHGHLKHSSSGSSTVWYTHPQNQPDIHQIHSSPQLVPVSSTGKLIGKVEKSGVNMKKSGENNSKSSGNVEKSSVNMKKPGGNVELPAANLKKTGSVVEKLSGKVEHSSSSQHSSASDQNGKPEKTRKKSKPPGTTDYEVKEWDTLESIAAFYDLTPSELMKLNKLTTRYLFPGQNIYVPTSEYGGVVTASSEKLEVGSPPREKPKLDVPLVRMADRPPAKVPGHVERIPTPVSSPKQEAQFEIPHKLSEEEASQLDKECYERFIKVNVKHITDGQGVVSGVLLVTPNAVMFDPNVSDPLVLEHGAEQYGVIAPMDMVVSAAMYHDIAAMKVKGQRSGSDCSTPRPEVYHDKSCPLYKSWCEEHNKGQGQGKGKRADSGVDTVDAVVKDVKKEEKAKVMPRTDSVCSCGPNQNIPPLDKDSIETTVLGTNSQAKSSFTTKSSGLGSEAEDDKKDLEFSGPLEMHALSDFGDFVSAEPVCGDVGNEESCSAEQLLEKQNQQCSSEDGRKSMNRSISEEEKDEIDEINSARDNTRKTEDNPKIGSESKTAEKDSVFSADVLRNTSLEPTQKVRSHSSPIEIQSEPSSRRTLSSSSSPDPKASSSFGSFNVTPHLSAFVNYATGLFRGSDIKEVKDVTDVLKSSETDTKKNKEDATDGSRRDEHAQENKDLEVAVENAVKLADKPELFQSFDKLIPRPATTFEDPPLYLCLRLGKPINKHVSQTAPIQAYSKKKKKPEYWFSIPRDKVDQLYAFFVQWKPEIYGDEEEMSAENRGFVVLDEESTPDEMEIHEDYFNSTLQKDWEIISADEALRRKSMDVDDSLILPEFIGESTILQDFHVQMLNKHMPARTVGYPWTLNYSTDQHGFSLKTLYRDMHRMDSPVLLVVKDTHDNIFGALTSCELKISDHFYGTGESFLFTFFPEFKVFRWTGDNSLFIKGSAESIAIGAGQGNFGLWLDGDLYHGRTNRCETYDNDVLTDSEDFVVKAFEAWIFTQD